MKLKHTALVAALVAAVAGISHNNTAQAQIPVTDVASIAKNVANHAETILRWKQQFDQMHQQYSQMVEQYRALTGARNLGQILNDPRLRDYVPADWRNIYNQIQVGGVNGLTGAAKAIYESNRVYDMCSGRPDKANCEAEAALNAQVMANIEQAVFQAGRRLNQINSLMHTINSTTDPKSIAELQGRINAEVAMINNEAMKLQMYEMATQAQQRIIERRQREEDARFFADPSTSRILK